MTVELNHTIVWCRDNKASSRFLAGILGRPEPRTFHHFEVVELDNGVSIDFMVKHDGPPAPQHYAFLVDDATFDHGFARVQELGLIHWADPARKRPGEINRNDGGRGFYFEDPDGHFLELLTTPYGVAKQ
jgi:catechol 2,3-dioxygenase-like lactoylglutathione lyase family enzyme